MDLGIKVYYKGQWTGLDLFDNESVLISKSVLEYQDFTRRTSEFTKAFRIPGTPTNNQVLGNIFKINLEDSSFNPQLKTKAAITVNERIVVQGNIRLEEIYISDKRNEYQIVIYAQLGDLASNIKDKTLCDLDLSQYDHNNDYYSIVDSWFGRLFDGDILYPFIHQGYETDSSDIIPEIEFKGGNTNGYFDNDAYPLPSWYFKPAIRVQKLVEAIINGGGYKMASEFMDSSYFQRLYTPLTFNDTNGPTGHQLTTFGATMTVDDNFGTDGQIIFDQEGYDPDGDYDPTTGYYTIPREGEYTFSATFKLSSTGCCRDINVPTNVPASITYGLVHDKGGGNIHRDGETDIFACDYDGQTITVPFTMLVDGTHFEVGDKVAIFIEVTEGFEAECQFTLEAGTSAELLTAPYNRYDGPIVLSQEMDCGISQVEYLKSVVKYFNLVIYPDYDDPTTLRLEPWNNWINDEQATVRNWTEFLDLNKDIVLQPIVDNENRYVNFTDQEGEDVNNVNYQSNQNQVFGEFTYDSGAEIITETTTVDTIFQPCPSGVVKGSTDMIVPLMYDQDDSLNQTPISTKPMIVYYNGLLPLEQSWYMASNDTTSLEQPYYPCVSTTEVLNNPTPNRTHKTLTWQPVENYYKAGSGQTMINAQGSLYELYWKDYIKETYSENSRLATAYFQLPYYEYIQTKLNDKIELNSIFGGTRWRINRIIDFDLVAPGPIVKVELIKILEKPKDIPVFIQPPLNNYRLRLCDGVEERIAGLTTQLLAIGNSVKLITDERCWEVIEIVEDDAFFQIDPNSVYVDCDTCEAGPVPTPTPTPQPTPTPTPTPIPVTPTPTPSATPVQGTVYQAVPCDSPGQQFNIISSTPLNTGLVYYLTFTNLEQGCYEIINSIPGPYQRVVQTVGNLYDNCVTCEADN